MAAPHRDENRSRRISARLLSVICALTFGVFADPLPAQENAGQEAELRKVLRSVNELRVFELAGPDGMDPRPVAPHPRPAHHYGDQERQLFDSTLWMWGGPDDGRPVAAMKLERYPEDSYYGRPTILYGFVSLSPQRVRVELPEAEPWTSRQSGIDLRDIPDSPDPADADRRRALQARALARRFTAHVLDAPGQRPSEQRRTLRLMPRPLYEYTGDEHGIPYGALFAFANGTNPDVLLLIEARSTDAGPRWQYGIARLTRGQILVQLDGRQVLDAPATPIPAREATYLIHLEHPVNDD